ncbi:Trafficking protein particle complex subunit 1 [Babesia bigemina]|uniref:Trafficking protein particle complex subunit n=1 Tax=Babesia bigemina TaxID=5866 RepID=A0A061D134_BABBI|nr:Trafficking protein particle complex subunit 1 [Babesia bigemina]CDR94531.1 Trafficking protein particle complex subunit 1 [Babesia bigemina]|eukprot:XP_012766717.1 Trafficking protein particle complex subunit 1 [Babesia bigemina]
MAELHSFHIFFRQRCIHRYLCSDAVVTAVKRCMTLDNARDKSSSAKGAERPATDSAAVADELAEYNHHYEKLLVGFMAGLSSFCKTIHVTNELERPNGLSVSYFNVCATSTFKIHYFETITGYKLVCITSPEVANLELTMSAIYTDLLVTMVLSNPLYTVGGVIDCPEFEDIVAKTLRANM